MYESECPSMGCRLKVNPQKHETAVANSEDERVHTTSRAYEVLLLDWNGAGRGRLVQLEQGFAWILPSGGLINVAEEKKKRQKQQKVKISFLLQQI